ncbi:MAG: sigma-54 dependent transcriptional regulator [Gemmatimonadetes bacterium]|nr:sigma-54 dependent transcriptional regulator [Gemmatimonadota bacterium]
MIDRNGRGGSGREAAAAESGDDSHASGRILVIEDDEQLRSLLRELLVQEGYDVAIVESGEEGLQTLQRELFDVVLLDINLPGMHGINVLTAAPNTQTDAAFIMMTAFAEIETAVEAMKLGAFDFLTKPLEPEQLLLIIERALERTSLRREVARLRRAVPHGPRERVIGRSKALERVFDLIERVAPTRSTVLVTGETGTGKELVARAVHDLSPRANAPFVPINCSALPESLLESELFGHMKGSFTGAIANRRGLFEEAHGGTLFLDEASTIGPPIQVKLLRVLQERQIQRVGGTRQIPVDFRLIAATNVDLTQEVTEGRFREDLYFRLNVFPLEVPPLRERKDDIPLLADHFRRRWAEANEMDPPAIAPETLQRMIDYDWPGNVRELENFIERAMIMYAGSDSIRFDPPQAAASEPHQHQLERARDEGWTVDRLEREHILSILESVGGNQTRASEVLGIDRRTLYRKLKRYREGETAR